MKLSDLNREQIEKLWEKNKSFKDLVFETWLENQYIYIDEVLNCFDTKKWKYEIDFCSSVQIEFNCETYEDMQSIYEEWKNVQSDFGVFTDTESQKINKLFQKEKTYKWGIKRLKKDLINFFNQCFDYTGENDLLEWIIYNPYCLDYIFIDSDLKIYKPI